MTRLGILGAAVLFALAGCAPAERARTDTATAEAENEQPREGGRLVRRFESDVNTLNFIRHTTAFEKNVLSYIHAGLVELDQNLEVVPSLARSWTVSPDGLVWVFELDGRATFSDGRPVTADDVVFTLSKIVDPASGAAQYESLFDSLDLENTVAVDADTVRVTFTSAKVDQLLSFNIAILPRHFYSSGNFARDYDRKVLGAGPYVLESHEAGRSLLLRRREDYWREKPWIHEVQFQIIPDDAMAWNAIRRGEIDETRMNSDQWIRERDNPAVREAIDLRRFYMLSYNFIPWNTRDPILSDVRVRRALAMCFNRRSVITNLFHGTARVVTGPYVPDQWAYNPTVKAIEFDPIAARRLLESAGWTDSNDDGVLDRNGRPLDLEILLASGNAGSAAQGQVFQDGLKQAGVRARLTTLDPPVLFERILSGKFQGAFLAWDLDLDPDLYALFHSTQAPPNGSNFVGYSNREVDRIIEEARVTRDQDKRRELYHRLHARLAADQPYLWLVQVSTKWGIRKRVENVEEADGLGLYLWYPGPLQWWLSDEGTAGKTLSTPE